MSDILIVDDEADIRALVADILQDEGHTTRTAEDADGALAQVAADPPALIILDIWLQGSRMDGIEVLKSVKRDNPDIPVVIISGHGNIEIAVAAIQQGAYDFIEKPFTTSQLMVVVGRALEANRLRRENAALRARDAQEAEMVGASAAMVQLAQKIQRVARTQSRILLSGPPGCGKEVAARRIHALSDRAQGPFVVVNAAAVEPHRMEEVLFGAAADGRVAPGLFERAHRGVLFIDEVGEMPPGTQSKILRVLTDSAFTRPGGDVVRVDVRVVSATNRDLPAEIAAGRFREDLFHRLSVVPIEVPGLDARREDIPALVSHFAALLSEAEGLPRKQFTPEALALLQTLDWPGNVRQLKNLVERLLIISDGTKVDVDDVAGDPAAGGGGGETRTGLSGMVASLPLREAREVFEREYLIAQINRFGGNISRTASFVGMERSALHRKLKLLGVTTTSRGGARVATLGEGDALDDADLDAEA
jgi:two-component system nitrogen regulation response regulator NtrX